VLLSGKLDGGGVHLAATVTGSLESPCHRRLNGVAAA